METILYTKNDDFVVKSVYIPSEACFATVLVYPDESQMVLETYKSIIKIMEKHDFWCKFTGVISTPFTGSQVEKHLTSRSLRAY